ncbi:doubtful CDS [Blastococcus saxobsidens DD2]|uniref:Doubtful CDS n=1 Tax=Blastococcus saxobsidens (strain DD2) TaxID=1146883 RepID=H6RVR4_BLASD|nr:doubtful CDS [Blastococcus saxobsidens DD2]
MIPSTGSSELDTIGQIAIALLLVVTIVLLIRNYRGR